MKTLKRGRIIPPSIKTSCKSAFLFYSFFGEARRRRPFELFSLRRRPALQFHLFTLRPTRTSAYIQTLPTALLFTYIQIRPTVFLETFLFLFYIQEERNFFQKFFSFFYICSRRNYFSFYIQRKQFFLKFLFSFSIYVRRK